MFIPYKAKIKITRVPTMTIIVVIVCLLVFWAQDRNEDRITDNARSFCTPQVAVDIEWGQKQYIKSELPCWDVLVHIHYHPRGAETHLKWHVDKIEAGGNPEAARLLVEHYRAFARQTPVYLTEKLVKYSGQWNPLRMLTATISHGSWDHVIGNLFFFVAFSMVVETVIGPVLFLLVFLAMGLGTGALENLLTATREGGSGLGLSGVVMGMMTLAAYFSPKVKIKFFYFFFLIFGVLSWPLWSVAAWYVFWNIWDYLFWRDWVPIGFAAHLAGAAMGLILGITLFRQKRHWVHDHLVPDEPTINDEESWLYKFNVMAATPVVVYFVFFYGMGAFLIALYLIIRFFETFAVQMLLAAPAVAAAIQIWRLKRPPTPQWELYQKGLAALDAHKFQEALKHLTPLAEGGYARAQFALGRLYATRPGGYRNDPEALRWLRAAAERGLPEAQHEMGARHLHGNQLPKDMNLAIAWLEKAAAQGVGQAANSLGHLYENMLGNKEDREKAIEWYYRAGVAFQKAGQRDDAIAVIRHLQGLAGKYPLVLGYVARLEKLCAPAARGAQ
jgi:membrane associated rhomboid family serine protease